MKRIGIIGAAGVGKTTLSNDLASELRNLGKTVEVSNEFAREYIQKFGEPKNSQVQTIFLQKQVEREAKTSSEYLISDSPVILSLIYGLELGSLGDLQDCFCFSNLIETLFQLKLNKFYDFLFYIPREIEFEKDGVRDYVNTKRVDNRIRGFLNLFNIRYYTISNKSTKKELNKEQSRKHRVSEALKILKINSKKILKLDEQILKEEVFSRIPQVSEIPTAITVPQIEENPKAKRENPLLTTTKKQRLKDLILAGETQSFALGEIQFIVKNFNNKPGRKQYRHMFRDCLSLAKRNFDLQEISKGNIQKYPLCPHCEKRLNQSH